MTALLGISLIAVSCADDDGPSAGADLEIERRVGFSVIVEERSDGESIGFSEDRDASSGEEFDVTEAVWRIDDGPWNEPPVACLAKGQRVELGIAQVENVRRPGLLKQRVVWIACLSPDDA